MRNKVLLVDDDKDLANILKDFFTNDGIEAAVAYNAKSAYEKVVSFSPNLIILDIMLPDGDGIELLRHIRQKSDVPVIMLSAKNEDVSKILALGIGADKYLSKPYSPSVILAEAKAILRRYANNNKNGKLIYYDNLQIDKVKMSIKFYEEEVDLIGKEFELFAILAENNGRVFTKEELYDKVWGEDEFGEISTVSVHICRIRNKLEKCNEDHMPIKTMWGIGYKFEY